MVLKLHKQCLDDTGKLFILLMWGNERKGRCVLEIKKKKKNKKRERKKKGFCGMTVLEMP